MVAVGDQQLAGLELGCDRLVHGRVANPPDAVGRAIGVGHLAPGIAAERRLDALPDVARMEGEDRGEVVPGRASESQAVLLRSRLGALVRADALAVLCEADPGEE